jgi:zinc transport system ATP-binding protein
LTSPFAPQSCAIGHAIEIDAVSVRLGGVTVLENISASVPMGQLTALIGPNGAGKTTLLMALLGLVPYSGRVRFCACGEHGSGAPRVGYVPQHLDFDRATPISVLDFMCLAGQRRPLWLGHRRAGVLAAGEALERVGANRLAARMLGQLSGGELQRVLLAQALLDEPQVILLDEPVAGVDVAGGNLFLRLVQEMTRDGRCTVLMVSHDISVVAERAANVIAVNRTLRFAGEAREVLTAENLLGLFGVHLHFLGTSEHMSGRCSSCANRHGRDHGYEADT